MHRRWTAFAVIFAMRSASANDEPARSPGSSLGTLLTLEYAPVGTSGSDDNPRDPSDAAQELIHHYLATQYSPRYVQLDLDVNALAGLTMPAAIGGTIDVGWDLPDCRALGAKLSGLLGREQAASLHSHAFTGTVCFPFPLVNTWELSFTRRVNVRTSLLAGPMRMRDRYVSTELDMAGRLFALREGRDRIEFMPLEMHMTSLETTDGRSYAPFSGPIDMSVAEWHGGGRGLAGRDQVVRILRFRFWLHDSTERTGDHYLGPSSLVVRFSPVAIDGVHLGEHVTTGAEVGYEHGDGRVDDDVVVERSTVHAETWVNAQYRALSGELRAAHGLMPIQDGQFLVDSRVAGQLALTHGKLTAQAQGFVGRTRLMRAGTGSNSHVLAGGAGTLAWAMHRNLTAIGAVELARSLENVRTTDPVAVATDVRATVGLTAHWTRRMR
jgi:hypothetical protein